MVSFVLSSDTLPHLQCVSAGISVFAFVPQSIRFGFVHGSTNLFPSQLTSVQQSFFRFDVPICEDVFCPSHFCFIFLKLPFLLRDHPIHPSPCTRYSSRLSAFFDAAASADRCLGFGPSPYRALPLVLAWVASCPGGPSFARVCLGWFITWAVSRPLTCP